LPTVLALFQTGAMNWELEADGLVRFLFPSTSDKIPCCSPGCRLLEGSQAQPIFLLSAFPAFETVSWKRNVAFVLEYVILHLFGILFGSESQGVELFLTYFLNVCFCCVDITMHGLLVFNTRQNFCETNTMINWDYLPHCALVGRFVKPVDLLTSSETCQQASDNRKNES